MSKTVLKDIVNLQKKWLEKEVSVSSLLLDEENIRLDIENKTQDAVIMDLFVNEEAIQILESIYKNGLFPDEIPVVVKEGDKYIVIDGNRRIVSLKAMLMPGIVPKQYQGRVEKLMDGYKPIEKTKVIVAPSRRDADRYLAAKHTKNTRRPWSALRRAFFYYAQKESGVNIEKLIERYANSNIPRYIRMYEMQKVALSLKGISDYVRQIVSNKNFEISTLERLYDDKYVQDRLGISFDSKTGQVSVPSNPDFDKAFSKIITDISEGTITSRKEIKDSGDRKKYLDSFVKDKISTTKRIRAEDVVPRKVKITVQKNLVPDNLYSTLESPAIERVLSELKQINYRKFPNLTADALRSLLEAVLKKYFDRIGNSVPKPERGGHIYLSTVLRHAEKYFIDQENREMEQVIKCIRDDKDFLEMINHNPSVFATGDRTKDSWDTMQELFFFIFKDVSEKNKKV